MQITRLVLACFLIAAAPAEVPMGKFETWIPSAKTPLDFASSGVSVHVEALPCPAQATGDTACRWDGNNNQAAVTVSAAGMVPLTVKTDGASSYARIAVVRLDKHGSRPGVIVESHSGGSGETPTFTVEEFTP